MGVWGGEEEGRSNEALSINVYINSRPAWLPACLPVVRQCGAIHSHSTLLSRPFIYSFRRNKRVLNKNGPCFMVLFSSDRIALKLINYSKLSGRVKRTLSPTQPLYRNPGEGMNLHFGQLISWWPCWNRTTTRKKCFSSTCGLLIIGIKLNRPLLWHTLHYVNTATAWQAGDILDQVPKTITWKKLLYVAVDGGGGGEEVSTPEIKQLSLVQCMGVHACGHCWPN